MVVQQHFLYVPWLKFDAEFRYDSLNFQSLIFNIVNDRKWSIKKRDGSFIGRSRIPWVSPNQIVIKNNFPVDHVKMEAYAE